MYTNPVGFQPKDKDAICRMLDRELCALAVSLDSNLLVCWLSRGSRLAEQYRRKRDITWEQYNTLGMRIARLGGTPTLNPIRQHQIAGIRYRKLSGQTVRELVKMDLEAEVGLLSLMRSHLAELHRLDDWVGLMLLASFVKEREELVADIVGMLEQEQWVELLWDQEALEMETWNPIH